MKKLLQQRSALTESNGDHLRSSAGFQISGLLGFVLLSALVLLLFCFILYEAWVLHSLGGLLVGVILFGLCAALVKAGHLSFRTDNPLDTRELLLIGLAHMAGAWTTFELSHSLGMGAVLASALVGLLGGILFPRYGAPIYCGSFVGMCSAEVYFRSADVLLASAIAGMVFILGREMLNGFGGKLGTIAFGGTLLTGLGFRRQFIVTPVPPFNLAWHIALYATLAALLTYWLSISIQWGPVIGSAVVGLLGGLLLPFIHPESGGMFAVVAFCASFTGMSSVERLPSYGLMTLAGLFTGVVFLYSMPIFGGAGGKLGTIAFGSSLAMWGYSQLFSQWQKARQSRP